ncbi:MAG: ParB-like nuclease [Anaeromyxobacteraceae bacterium]|nr:ParB-like nuclease [Anaeromyxobacteraceae bacterium]
MEHVPLDEVSPDATFRLREPGDVSELAVAIGRLGQLTPVELRPFPPGAGAGAERRYQVVAGFRRMEALRLLQRERVLARVHPSLTDDDAWALALAGPLFSEPWSPAELAAIAGRVRAHLPWAVPPESSAPPPVARPRPAIAADPAALAHALAVRAYELNGEVAAAYEGWGALPAEGRRLVLEQLRYLFRMFPLLEKENR